MSMRRLLRDESGVALLEFAILATLLLLLVFGTIDLGRAMWTASSLTSAAREGARYGAVLANPITRAAAIESTTVAKMAYTFGSPPLTTAHVVVNYDPPGANLSNLRAIQVQIDYPFRWLTGLPGLMRWGTSQSRTLKAQATFRWEGS